MSTTARLYYSQPATQAFDASVVRTEPRGAHTAVWLDRTAFYPTSGGQPHDLGTLDGAPVIDVQDDDAGDVMHLVGAGAPQCGAAVHGVIDWTRRFDHMQQHTGQHLLSAMIEKLFSARTVSFHLGSESSTIDLDRELTPAQLARVEHETNAVIWRDAPVSIRFVTEEDAKQLPLRKESARAGTLRLVEIEGVDLSACGGTHVDRTGAIGQLALDAWERFKGGQRLEFLCGVRAMARFQQLRDVTAASIRQLSVLPIELPGAIERLQQELKEQKRTSVALQVLLAGYEAVTLANDAEPFDDGRLVLQAVEADAAKLKALASAIAERPGYVAVLVSRSTPVLAVAARAADAKTSCQEIIASLATQFGGRGGGKPDLAQCGALQASPEAVIAAVRVLIARPA
ncbi:MAG: alanyl-tRNA editing protein [Vicinamibacterales bacterium]